MIIRTLDIGEDKALPYLGLPTEESILRIPEQYVSAYREKEDIYKPQLRALLRASAFGKVRIMVPLVTCVDELSCSQSDHRRTETGIRCRRYRIRQRYQVGVMMETATASNC